MSSDPTGSSGQAVASSSSSRATRPTAHAMETPRPTAAAAEAHRRRRNNKHLSTKQLDKIVRNINSVQRHVGHLRSDSAGSLPGIGDLSLDVGHEGGGEENYGTSADAGRRQLALLGLTAEDGDLLGDGTLAELHLNQTPETERWLQRQGIDKALVRGAGKGPDGLALAQVAAKGRQGKGQVPPDSFLDEPGFVFHPLNTRLPPQTPGKQAISQAARSRLATGFKTPKGPAKTTGRTLDHVEATKASKQHTSSPSETAQTDGAQTSDSMVEALAEAPKEIQEALVLEDLLFVLMGIEGQYIQLDPTYEPEDLGARLRGADFVIDAGLDRSLQDLVQRILPLAKYFTAITAFVETESHLEFGTVVHAMCAAIRDLLKEYEVLIIQLEHQMASSSAFTLQKLWFYIHPTLHTMSLLYAFITEISEVSHANAFDSDDEEGEGQSSDEDDEDEDEDDSMDRRRRALLRLEEEGEVDAGLEKIKGGEMLSLLYDRVIKMGGDEAAHKLFSSLLFRASQPYARILVHWITTGHLSDTYDEFLIMENAKVTQASLESDPTDEFWERRYMLRDEAKVEEKEHERQQGLDLDEPVDENDPRGIFTGGAKIPSFLEPWKRKILLAGKYLNVIRECGKDIDAIADLAEHAQQLAVEGLEIDMTDETFFQHIERAYQLANTALLSLLIDEHDIVARLRSMKHYFLQCHADFFSSFIEAASRELHKAVLPDRYRDVTVSRLQSHLGMVLGSSNCVGYTDPYREDIKISLAPENAYDHLKRIAEIRAGVDQARARTRSDALPKERVRVPLMDLIQFDLSTRFPVSLVISKRNILRWQFLQRPLIHLRFIELQLGEVLLEHQQPAWRRSEQGHAPLQRWKLRIFHLRHRMVFFVQQLLSFMTAEVLEPNWRELEVKMQRAKTVDQFLKDHFDFLNLCRKECMLTDERFLDYMQRLTSSIHRFCDSRLRFREQLDTERASWQRAQLEDQRAPAQVGETAMALLAKMERNWEHRLHTFKVVINLLATTHNPSALPLSYRLQTA